MLVVPNKRKLVLNARNYAPIVEAIPHAKVFEHEGKTLTAVDHGVEEVQVLRNLGYKKLPSPILHYYDWPARFPAMEHQKHTASFLTSHRRALVLSAPGSGKSISSLWAADYLLQEGVVRRVLIVAPLSTLKPVWAKELVHHMPHRAFRVITGTRERREQLIEDEHDFGIVNHDGFTTMPDAFARYDLIIYDEATSLKTPSSIRFKKFLNHMNKYNPRLWLMTGTPIAQSPVDAWALAKLVGSSVLPRSFTGFKDLVMQKVTQFKWVPRSNALDICQKVLQPSIRYDLSECKELPDTVFIDRECELTAAQRRAYKEMSDEAVIVSANITAANAAVLFQKLIQISCGACYDANKNIVHFDDSDRTNALLELLSEIGDKAIVYVPLRNVQDKIHALLQSKGIDVEVVHGDVSKTERDRIFHEFQNTEKITVLLAHPKVASHGLTLTRAKSIIWYAPIYSLEMYEQANARIRRLTTEGKTTVYHLYATPFEKELYRRLKLKQKVLADFLNLVSGENG